MERTTVRIHTRSIDRKVARNKMERKGMVRICNEVAKPRSPRKTILSDKKGWKNFDRRSYFSLHWREVANK